MHLSKPWSLYRLSKVTKLDRELFSILNEHIFQFDVSMDNTFLLQMPERLKKLFDNLACFILSKLAFSEINQVEEVPMFNVFCDDVIIIIIVVKVVKLQNIEMLHRFEKRVFIVNFLQVSFDIWYILCNAFNGTFDILNFVSSFEY